MRRKLLNRIVLFERVRSGRRIAGRNCRLSRSCRSCHGRWRPGVHPPSRGPGAAPHPHATHGDVRRGCSSFPTTPRRGPPAPSTTVNGRTREDVPRVFGDNCLMVSAHKQNVPFEIYVSTGLKPAIIAKLRKNAYGLFYLP